MRPFNEFIFNNGLMDMGFIGHKFTWSNCQEGEDNIKERIDRVLCNLEWRRSYERAIVYHEPMIGSDHAPLRIQLDGRHQRKNTPFRFDTRWIEYPSCSEVAMSRWSERGDCHTKLKSLSGELKKWSKETVGNSSYNIRKLQGEIKGLLTLPRTEQLIQREKTLLQNLKEEWKKEELIWGQRSINNWLRKGDRTMKFFHTTTIQRMHQNMICQLKTREGRLIEEKEELKCHIKTFFKGLFTANEDQGRVEITEGIPQVISLEMNEDLTRQVTEDEIKKAVYGLGPDKSPGLDGFLRNFYRKY
ncbi:Transposon TX1 uncharacterized 149 kDa protein [Linum perenne]